MKITLKLKIPIIKNIDNEENVVDEIDDDLIDKWGEREEKDYKRLERKYKKYIKKYPIKRFGTTSNNKVDM